MARERALSKTFATQIADYMDAFVATEQGKGNNISIGLYETVQGFSKLLKPLRAVSVEDIQNVSLSDTQSLVISAESGKADLMYKGDKPYDIQHRINGEYSVMYVDELIDQLGGLSMLELDKGVTKEPQHTQSAPQESVKESVVSTPSAEAQESSQPLATQNTPAKKAETSKQSTQAPQQGLKPLVLTSISKHAVKFRDGKEGKPGYVNVAVPWKDSKNGLAYMDISQAVFDKANPEDQRDARKTYRIPLEKREFGLWYLDKNTGKAMKPRVSAQAIYDAYNANKQEYREARKRMQQEASMEQAQGQQVQVAPSSTRQGVELNSAQQDVLFGADLDFA